MSIQEQYTQRLGLANLDVYLETPENDNSYFNITGLPPIFGYGKVCLFSRTSCRFDQCF